MEINTTIHNNHVITSESGTQRGIFFRSPIQKVSFDAYYTTGPAVVSAWTYLNKIKNPIRRLYEILIGNVEIVKNINEWANNMDWGGFTANKLMSPIYFRREYRYLESVSSNTHDVIQKVVSYGYEGPYNMCSGACHIERTRITLRNGKKIRLKKTEYYHYTYIHIVERMISSGNIDND